jgi:hypothetical protein
MSLLLQQYTLSCTSCTSSLIDSGSDFESSNRVSWIAVAYILSNTACQPLYGRLSDIFGRKSCLIFANSVFLVGTLGCAVSPGLWTLVASRMVAGIGGGGLNVMVLSTIRVLISGNSDIVRPCAFEETRHISGIHEYCLCFGDVPWGANRRAHGGLVRLAMVLWNSSPAYHPVHFNRTVSIPFSSALCDICGNDKGETQACRFRGRDHIGMDIVYEIDVDSLCEYVDSWTESWRKRATMDTSSCPYHSSSIGDILRPIPGCRGEIRKGAHYAVVLAEAPDSIGCGPCITYYCH